MSDPEHGHGHWCHTCRRSVSVNDNIECSICGGGFVEQIEVHSPVDPSHPLNWYQADGDVFNESETPPSSPPPHEDEGNANTGGFHERSRGEYHFTFGGNRGRGGVRFNIHRDPPGQSRRARVRPQFQFQFVSGSDPRFRHGPQMMSSQSESQSNNNNGRGGGVPMMFPPGFPFQFQSQSQTTAPRSPNNPNDGSDQLPEPVQLPEFFNAMFGQFMNPQQQQQPSSGGNESPSGASRPQQPQRRSAGGFGGFLSNIMNNWMGAFGLGGGGGGPQAAGGTFGDFAWGDLNSLIERLMSSDPNFFGRPPAPQQDIDKLTKRKVVQSDIDGDKACAVCTDDFEIGQDIVELPCYHIYHPDCVLQWLKLHDSCPICRFSIHDEKKDADKRGNNDRHRNDDNDSGHGSPPSYIS